MGREKVIFLIEDDTDDYLLFIDVLGVIGESAVCIRANDGDVALLKLQEPDFIPDIIFLDINMPRMNGVRCITELKKLPILRDIPVVIYSTTIRQSDIRIYKDLGAADVLTKSTSFREFVSEIRKVLEKYLVKE